ncbi:hypothetical protein N7489_001819 [Penicillium chrysogenum]|uniref:uncharacterized protein n=1 Tax=Penicillium chrysogenum TaxID=5076 RepID=UPI0023A4C406|nr:uncharacterized protein N7489_001819 [Penicillium chrysogenum]KAJ5251409.1 hypothetical protein N7489_001819 [Penicillium chrysogenum]KAJ5262841.1 hypothetical protein N7524_008146 [Penicillium chrysogenum]KAJ6146946.1 hypothetical protein N7497_008928 [Penicillium chrysogenum]
MTCHDPSRPTTMATHHHDLSRPITTNHYGHPPSPIVTHHDHSPRTSTVTIHFNKLPRSTTSSLSVAGFGFRTIGRLVWSTIHFNKPRQSTQFKQPLPVCPWRALASGQSAGWSGQSSTSTNNLS